MPEQYDYFWECWREHGTNLLVHLDVLHHLQCECKVTEKNVYSQQTDNTEVSEHAV